MSGKTARHRGGHDAKRTERLSAGQMQDRVTEMAYPARGPRIQKGKPLKGKKRPEQAILSTQTPQVGVAADNTRKLFDHGVLETLPMSLRATHDLLIPPLTFLFAIKQDSRTHERFFPKREMMGPTERSSRYKIELTAEAKKRSFSAHVTGLVTGRAARAVGKRRRRFHAP